MNPMGHAVLWGGAYTPVAKTGSDPNVVLSVKSNGEKIKTRNTQVTGVAVANSVTLLRRVFLKEERGGDFHCFPVVLGEFLGKFGLGSLRKGRERYSQADNKCFCGY